MIGALILAAKLAATLATGDVTLERAASFALPAVLVCDDFALCAAIGVRESRLVPDAVNARSACWGVMQVSSRRPRRMTAWAGVEAGERKLVQARAYCGGKAVCVVSVFVAGNGWRGAKAQRRARAVLRRAARIRAAINGRQAAAAMRVLEAAASPRAATGVAGGAA